MSSWITITPRLQQGLEIVSQLDNGKFRLLVNHICQGLYTAVNKIFTPDKEEKLMISLGLTKETLTLLLDTITLIYSQAAFSVVKPAVMETTMMESFTITDEKIAIFVNAWITHAKRIVDVLRQKSIFPTQVDDINWSLNVQAASSEIIIDAKPIVLLQLGLTGCESTEKKTPLTIEMDKCSVGDLYHKLEKIQSQLDALK